MRKINHQALLGGEQSLRGFGHGEVWMAGAAAFVNHPKVLIKFAFHKACNTGI